MFELEFKIVTFNICFQLVLSRAKKSSVINQINICKRNDTKIQMPATSHIVRHS